MAARNPIRIGEKVNLLTILADAGVSGSGVNVRRLVTAQCDCGNVKIFRLGDIRSGNSKSCGCLNIKRIVERNYKHGHKVRGQTTSEYESWLNMVRRCVDHKNLRWDEYGGRGILVCDRWRYSFENFFADMGKKPSPSHSIDRMDNDGNYEPGNCRWATDVEQANNKSVNVVLEFGGLRMTVPQWSDRVGISPKTLRDRIRRGWSAERALTERPKTETAK